ncbi:hypothetical protein QCA50_005575 [Cerrena zonata]|uniref:F-box domain-containing protein n=1 Tax=Cerrena zonata TaxID=2478898 RepID=A0AAW0GKN0_9APHY
MDSEDERDMKSQHDKSKSPAIEGYYARNGLELRPYEGDEAGTSGLFDQEEIRTDVAYYRLLRLLETMAGFHKGYTDLSGRHRQRYESIRLRYFRFARGLLTIYKLPSNDKELDIQLYLARWNAHRAMSSGELMQHIASVSRAIELSPDPKLQTLLLTGLPPEILYMIMDFEDKSIARSFGATCRRFHTISRSYIFRERELKLDHGEIDWVRSERPQ